MKKSIIVVVIVLLIKLLNAQAPQRFNYQVVARDAGGNVLANQNVTFLISIVKGYEGGPVVYMEMHSATTNAFGQVSLQVGGGTPVQGSFGAIDWGLNTHYVKTGLDPAGGTMFTAMGIAQLLSVPYALYANTSGSGGGGASYTAGTGIDITGQVISNSLPNAMHTGDAVGDVALTVVRLQGRDVSPAAPSGGQVLKWNGSSWAPGNDENSGGGGSLPTGSNKNTLRHDGTTWVASNLLSNTGDRIGIGTEWPYHQLEITQNFALPATSATAGNIYKDNQLFLHTTGFRGLFTGMQSGNLTLTGQENTAFGSFSLKDLISGERNTATGANALSKNTTGNNNTASGAYSLNNNQYGSDNTGFGSAALDRNVIGNHNTAVGSMALFTNLSSQNTALGSGALSFNSTGGGNTAVGYRAAYNQHNGTANTAIGYMSLHNNLSGEANVAVGREAMYKTTTSQNTAIGAVALRENTTGWGHVAVGGFALNANTTGNYNTAVGLNGLSNNQTGSNNAALGYNALASNTSGQNNTAIGAGAGSASNGSSNTFIGYQANATISSVSNASAIGANAEVNASNKMVLGNSSVTSVGGYAAWTNYSDRRLKDNIIYGGQPGLEFIKRLRTASYHYISDENKTRRDGLIAQDVEALLAELKLPFSALLRDEDSAQTLNLSYELLVLPLINAVQEQQAQIDSLSHTVSELKTVLSRYEAIIERLILTATDSANNHEIKKITSIY